jgi:hypothetical protein
MFALKAAIELDESLQGEVIEIKDDYMVGPLANIYETDGYQERRDWWKNLLEFSPYEDQTNIVDDKLAVHQLIRSLEENETEKVWIWMEYLLSYPFARDSTQGIFESQEIGKAYYFERI